jgi:2-methylcitrate dehydratase PrpD
VSEHSDQAGAPSLLETLAERLSKPVDEATVARAAEHVHDWIGCAYAGSVQPVGRVLAAALHTEGSGPCRALGQSDTVSPAAAAFHNGGLGNVLEMDDIHRSSRSHPGPVIIPAALAAAEWSGASPQDFLKAVVRGYEAALRIGRSLGPAHYALWHNTSTCGVFGAAAAVSDLLNLTHEQTVWALGNAGAQAAGPWRCRHEPVMTKQLHTAHAAADGLKAAMLAKHGFTGARFMLEGEQGFYAATAPDAELAAVNATPDAPWLVWETSFKPWPSCRFTHTAIDAALILREQELALDNIAKVRIDTYADANVICNEPTPVSEIQAKFSLQHAVAATLINGPPGLDQFRGASLTNPAIAALRARCQITETKRFNDAYPHHFGTAVVIELNNGSEFEAACADALGDPENPVSSEAIQGKARTLMADAGLDDASIAEISRTCTELAHSDSICALTQALASPTKPSSDNL